MSKESDAERSIRMQTEFEQMKKDMEELRRWKKSCEEVVVKWGFKFIIFLGLGALFGGKLDEIKKMILKVFM